MKDELLNILQCPTCSGTLLFNKTVNCKKCGNNFLVVNDIIILLTLERLQGFLKESWGKELVKEKFGAFVHSNGTLSDLQKIADKAKSEALQKNKEYSNPDPSISKDLDEAINRSRDILAEKSHVKTAQKILDWPTGSGFFLDYLVNVIQSNTLVVATDINFGQLATTKAYLDQTRKGKNVSFIVCDARYMPFRNNVFQSVTSWGGTVEIPNSNLAVKESHRVLVEKGWFGISGDLYKENSESFRVAKELGLSSLATKQRLEKFLEQTKFANLSYDVLYEGFDKDLSTPPEERCPLPAPGDWFSHIVASGQKT